MVRRVGRLARRRHRALVPRLCADGLGRAGVQGHAAVAEPVLVASGNRGVGWADGRHERRDRHDLLLRRISRRSRPREGVGGLHDEPRARLRALQRVDSPRTAERGAGQMRWRGTRLLQPAQRIDLRAGRRPGGGRVGEGSAHARVRPPCRSDAFEPAIRKRGLRHEALGLGTRTSAPARSTASSSRAPRISATTCTTPARRSPRRIAFSTSRSSGYRRNRGRS